MSHSIILLTLSMPYVHRSQLARRHCYAILFKSIDDGKVT